MKLNRKTISVNYPLINNSVYYYQTDWNLIGLRFQNERKEYN
jgi:cytochrome c biogenesis protein ResB